MRKTFIKGLVLLPFLLFLFQNISAQRWLQDYDFDQNDIFRSMHKDEEGVYIVSQDELIRVDSLGQFLWKTDFQYKVREVVFRENDFVTISVDTTQKRLVAYNYSGTLLWDFPLGYSASMLPAQTLRTTQSNELVIIQSEKVSNWDIRLVFEKRDENGNQLLKTFMTPPDTVLSYMPQLIVPLSDGTFFSMGRKDAYVFGQYSYAIRMDEDGNVLWEKEYGSNLINSLFSAKAIETSDGNLLISSWIGTAGGSQKIIKMTLQGDVVWEKEIAENNVDFNSNNIIEMPSSNFLHVSGFPLEFNINGNASVIKVRLTMFDINGDVVWKKDHNYFPYGVPAEYVVEIQYIGSNQLLMGGYINKGTNGNEDLFLAMTDTMGNIYPHFIGGSVFQDNQSDCQFDGGEAGIGYRIISFKNGNQTYHAVSNEDGQYEVNLPGGNYEASVENMYYWESCQPTYSISIDDSDDTTGLHVPMQPTIICPLMEVDIATPFLRLCAEGHYAVNYCNVGTVEAEDATLDVVLADGLTFLSADMPLLSQNGNTLTFDLGTVEAFKCSSFRIDVQVTCDEEFFGQTQCTEAHTYPDELCNNTYNGPDISLLGYCQNDSIFFDITNSGENMPTPFEYIVIEDNIILMTNDFQLQQGETKTSKIAAANGATYYMVAAQDPGLPLILGNAVATVTVEGCNGNINTGAFSQIPFDDGEPWLSIDCHPIIASFDPNDKTAFPSGWTEEHIIEDRTDLEYLIRFQNTGTDTAFKVVLVDTLSQFLDPATIRIGAGSHPFTFDLTGEGVAIFTFDNILLPDSTTNEPESHGFVKFRISQKPDNTIGIRIENTAYIYFDYNSAVQTNTVFHTIGEPWVQIVSGSVEVFEQGVQVSVFPNPFYEMATIELEGWQGTGGTLQLFDLTGKAILQKGFTGENMTLERKELPSGIYFFKITTGEKLVGTGKLVVR